MKPMPPEVRAYRRTREFTSATLPAALRSDHTTKPGVWGRIVVTAGSVRYRMGSSEYLLTAGSPGVIEPQVPHSVEIEGSGSFYVEFLRAEDS